MLHVQPTHIGLDIAKQIIDELQPETPILITNELLEFINVLLNQSIGLDNAGIYRIANKILTLIPFEQKLFEKITLNNAQNIMNIYLIHIIGHGNYCYFKPFKHRSTSELSNSGIIECSKIKF